MERYLLVVIFIALDAWKITCKTWKPIQLYPRSLDSIRRSRSGGICCARDIGMSVARKFLFVVMFESLCYIL